MVADLSAVSTTVDSLPNELLTSLEGSKGEFGELRRLRF